MTGKSPANISKAEDYGLLAQFCTVRIICLDARFRVKIDSFYVGKCVLPSC